MRTNPSQPTPPHKKTFPRGKKSNSSKGSQNLRGILGTQTFFASDPPPSPCGLGFVPLGNGPVCKRAETRGPHTQKPSLNRPVLPLPFPFMAHGPPHAESSPPSAPAPQAPHRAPSRTSGPIGSNARVAGSRCRDATCGAAGALGE